MVNFLEQKLVDVFAGKQSFSREELANFFRRFDPQLKEGTLAWRIHELKHKGVIEAIRRGRYRIARKAVFEPEISQLAQKMNKFVREKFPDSKFCIWETSWLNEFSIHQHFQSWLIIEIEKELAETLFFELKDKMGRDIFLNPDERTLDLYVSAANRPILLKNLISRSPVQARKNGDLVISVPSPEKILVDIFSEEKLFFSFQGNELNHIFREMMNKYSLNLTRMEAYARRRGKMEEIIRFVSDIT